MPDNDGVPPGQAQAQAPAEVVASLKDLTTQLAQLMINQNNPAAQNNANPVDLQLVDTQRPAPRAMELRPLKSAEPEDWQAWKEHFTSVCTINAWQRRRALAELKAAMAGPALDKTRDTATDDGATVTRNLQTFEDLFLPPRDTAAAFQTFNACRQVNGQSIDAYHARLKTLFKRAFSREIAEDSMVLVAKFAEGLLDTNAARAVSREPQLTYHEALQKAKAEITAMTLHSGMPSGNGASINAMQRGKNQSGSVTCHCCKGNHYVRDCPAMIMVHKYKSELGRRNASPRSDNTSDRPKGDSNGRNNGQNGRSGGNGRGGNGSRGNNNRRNNSNRQVNSVEDQDQQEDELLYSYNPQTGELRAQPKTGSGN